MAEVVNLDIIEKILIRLDVVDLIRCKSVCKSWQSLISYPRFIKTHLNCSHKKNHNRRFILNPFRLGPWDGTTPVSYLVGLSNGLICICTRDAEIIVANLCTRQVKKLPLIHPDFESLCWTMCSGFGYDSSSDDYKVVIGLWKKDQTYFHVFSLKSNVWKAIGQVKYKVILMRGTLCNGALHWVMFPQNHNNNNDNDNKVAIILAYDLSKEDYKEIPQPDDDALHQRMLSDRRDMGLGIMKESLCVFPVLSHPYHIWVMNKYNIKESWEKVGIDNLRVQVHIYQQLEKGVSYERWFHDDNRMMLNDRMYIVAPVFVQSLVSPHNHGQ